MLARQPVPALVGLFVLGLLGTFGVLGALSTPSATATFPICDNPAQHSNYSVGGCSASGQWLFKCTTTLALPANPAGGSGWHTIWQSSAGDGASKQRYKWISGVNAQAGCAAPTTSWWALVGNSGPGHGWASRAYVSP